MSRPAALMLVLLALAAAMAPSFAAPPAAPATPAASQPTAASWQNLLQRLGDNDFATRDAAQKELDKTTWHELPTLRQLADATTDAEVKARLTSRVVSIEDELMVNPPGLTFDLKNATFLDAADKLSDAVGIKFVAIPPAGAATGRFNFSARDTSFWQVIANLVRQQNFNLQESGTQLRLNAQTTIAWRRMTVAGPMAVIPQSIVRQRTNNLQAEIGTDMNREVLTMSFQVFFDPRLHVLKFTSPVFTSIVDENGSSLMPPPNGSNPSLEVNGRTLVSQSFSTSLAVQKGTRIVSAKGYLPVTLQLREERIDIADAEKKEGESFDLGGSTVKITTFRTLGDTTTVNLNLTRPPNTPTSSQQVVSVLLTDATGKLMMNSPLRGSLGTSMSTSYTPPFKLRLSYSTKTRDVSYPFELKDLPLP